MKNALVIGGTRFIGRHLVEELLSHDYSVILFNRAHHDNPFADNQSVDHEQGDRTNEGQIERLKATVASMSCSTWWPIIPRR